MSEALPVSNHKLYIITRNDLSAAYQLPQVAHGVAHFADEHPLEYKKWLTDNHKIVVFAVEDKDSLLNLLDKIQKMDAKHTIFKEPDLDYDLTTIVLVPCRKAKRVVEGLKLAGK